MEISIEKFSPLTQAPLWQVKMTDNAVKAGTECGEDVRPAGLPQGTKAIEQIAERGAPCFAACTVRFFGLFGHFPQNFFAADNRQKVGNGRSADRVRYQVVGLLALRDE